jgi:hypothetical protein
MKLRELTTVDTGEKKSGCFKTSVNSGRHKKTNTMRAQGELGNGPLVAILYLNIFSAFSVVIF